MRPRFLSPLFLAGLIWCGAAQAQIAGPPTAAEVAPAPEPPTLAELTARTVPLRTAKAINPENRGILAFKMEQIELLLKELDRLGTFAPTEYLTATKALLDRAEFIRDYKGDAGSTEKQFLLQERAYIAANDGSAQPYWIALPPNYNPAKKYPLAVFLHGYTTDISKVNPWIPPVEIVEAARKNNFIFAIPYGRRNTDFVQVGEDDLFAVRREAERLFSVDPNRIFLTGASMGGYGVWAAGLHSVGKWTALTPICGRTDFYYWFKMEREHLPAWKRILFDADDPRTLSLNSRNVPVFFQHGAHDFVVPTEHSRRMAADAKRLKLPFTYREDPEGDHYQDFQVSSFERAFSWMANFKPVPVPKDVTLITGDLKEATAHWASIQAFENYGQMARLDVSLKDGYLLEVTAKNVARFTLRPPGTLLKPGRPLSLKVNGQLVSANFDAIKPVIWEKSATGQLKNPQACGPFKNAFRDPFILVYGNAATQEQAMRFRQEWWGYADGYCPVKAATAVTLEDRKKYNLILFGTKADNPLIAELGTQMPLELTPKGYRIGDKEIAGEGLGLRLVQRSPWAEGKLIVIQSGLWWGERLPYNHKWDLVPDYVVYDSTLEASDNTNHPLEAGYFDGNWQLPTNPK